MPTYEYRCRECGETLDVVQSFTDDPLTECPACTGELKKVFSPVGISFKGGGFYKTDSRTGSPKSDTPAPSKDGDTKTSGSDSSSTDTPASTPSSSSTDSKGSSSGDNGSTSKKDTKKASSSSGS